MASAYSFSDVTIFYSEKELMNNVFLTISEGDRIGVVGRNGAGKSTFLRLLSGKEEPDHGEISVKRGMSVAYLPQTPVLREDDTITQAALDYLPARQGEDPSSAAYEAQTILTQLGFADLNQPVRELSGGQKRRVAIAGVMAMHPRVLVLDEPAAGLDPEGRDTILSQIKDYHKKTGITVLLVSHSMEDIAKYANRVLVMHRAKIAMYDTVENVFARAQELLELGLSVPQVTQIFLKLRQMGLDIPADVYTIPYAVKTIQKALAAKQAGEVQ